MLCRRENIAAVPAAAAEVVVLAELRRAELWAPAAAKGPLQIKILSYNTFWWNLFKLQYGNGIQQLNAPKAFDVAGFQECEDPEIILNPVGLSATFERILGEHAMCMAYNKEAWALLASGIVDVSEDLPTRYYGRRGSQWMRRSERRAKSSAS